MGLPPTPAHPLKKANCLGPGIGSRTVSCALSRLIVRYPPRHLVGLIQYKGGWEIWRGNSEINR